MGNRTNSGTGRMTVDNRQKNERSRSGNPYSSHVKAGKHAGTVYNFKRKSRIRKSLTRLPILLEFIHKYIFLNFVSFYNGLNSNLYFFAHLQVWSILFFQLFLCSIRRRGSSEILIKIRDTSLWKFVPFSRQAECEKFRLCYDTGSACYGCFRHSQRVCRCLENYSFGTEGTGKVKDR